MFKALNAVGADMMGTSDNCVPISRHSKDSSALGDLLHFVLPDEKPFIILKSKVEEYVFTDCALIYVERDNAAGTKRKFKRFDYVDHMITQLTFETAGIGMTDLAVGIKFFIGQQCITIDIVKAEVEKAQTYYRAIVALSRAQQRNSVLLEASMKVLCTPHTGRGASGGAETIVPIGKAVEELHNLHMPLSYASILEKHLHD